MPQPSSTCPKEMTHGPCGGVTDDQGCEVPGVTCPFADVVRWDGSETHTPAPPSWRWLTDLRLRRTDLGALEQHGGALVDDDQCVLLGEHLDDDTGWSPSEQARWVLEHIGVAPLVTLTCRGRTRVEAADEAMRIVEAGAAGVHCVTGDHPRARFGPDASAHFPFDSFELLELVRSPSRLLTAAASPQTRPVDQRAVRAADKVRAGADVVVANHVSDDAVVTTFAADVQQAIGRSVVVAAVPLLVDKDSVGRLAQFPGVHLPTSDVARVMHAEDPIAVGVEAASERAARLLADPAVVGVNLSGTGLEDPRARIELIGMIKETVRGRD